MRGFTDYTLAKRALLQDYRNGRVSRLEICDAHPELLRAARNVGEETPATCPVCGDAELRLVSYVFGDGLRRLNGRIWPRDELGALQARGDVRCYVVEVCPECSWNHLAQSFPVESAS